MENKKPTVEKVLTVSVKQCGSQKTKTSTIIPASCIQALLYLLIPFLECGVEINEDPSSKFFFFFFNLSFYSKKLIAQLAKNPPAMQETHFDSWLGKIHWRRDRLPLQYSLASLVAQLVKNLPAIQETCVRSLGWEDPMEKGQATHSSILA